MDEREEVQIEGRPQYQALIRVGDKYLVLAEEWGMGKRPARTAPLRPPPISHTLSTISMPK